MYTLYVLAYTLPSSVRFVHTIILITRWRRHLYALAHTIVHSSVRFVHPSVHFAPLLYALYTPSYALHSSVPCSLQRTLGTLYHTLLHSRVHFVHSNVHITFQRAHCTLSYTFIVVYTLYNLSYTLHSSVHFVYSIIHFTL